MNKKIRRQIGACHTIQQGWSESLCQIWLYLRVFARQRYSCVLRLSLNVKILEIIRRLCQRISISMNRTKETSA